ncbi:MAG: thiamine-phosphate kinase [Alphaproteobacteria bacterium]
MDEFSMIETYFAPLAMGHEGVDGMRDDGAVLSVPAGYELVVSSDTLNEGVHFMIGESPDVIARKALRVNLSDMASMGADPLSYQLNIAFPRLPEVAWLEAFSAALIADNKRFGFFCSGGDTTSIKSDYLSISITVLGCVPAGQAMRRSGAREGDVIVLSGITGDSALGLKILQEKPELAENPLYKRSVERFHLPEPRVDFGRIVRGRVHAAADISDGLIADCMHIARASGVGVRIDLGALQFSDSVERAVENGLICREDVVRGGDDYELIIAVSKGYVQQLLEEAKEIDLEPMVIGEFCGKGLSFAENSSWSFRIDDFIHGWKHF